MSGTGGSSRSCSTHGEDPSAGTLYKGRPPSQAQDSSSTLRSFSLSRSPSCDLVLPPQLRILSAPTIPTLPNASKQSTLQRRAHPGPISLPSLSELSLLPYDFGRLSSRSHSSATRSSKSHSPSYFPEVPACPSLLTPSPTPSSSSSTAPLLSGWQPPAGLEAIDVDVPGLAEFLQRAAERSPPPSPMPRVERAALAQALRLQDHLETLHRFGFRAEVPPRELPTTGHPSIAYAVAREHQERQQLTGPGVVGHVKTSVSFRYEGEGEARPPGDEWVPPRGRQPARNVKRVGAKRARARTRSDVDEESDYADDDDDDYGKKKRRRR
ncbi:hypothetical protein FA95DRAFT_892457 [Auriscalpium vulgare]|uniref:Uncharacterized protein n=1 Tax=Auriscalpium vulgare TaxID=40419 RepID=A0ACB8RZ18_9AGAM|nr:hypothetical protein FA95DRAFT_892457 [Auriscalpium vulgare]